MDYNLRTAIVDMKKQEEPGINYIYAKTYNYVYLRAKSIMRRETDVQQLMQDVYVKMIEASVEVEVENLYEWLGEHTYRLGCGYYRKKKAREEKYLESEDKEFSARMIEYPEATSDIIAKSLEQLPDLYQATYYAFYYDYISIERIADLMDCSEEVIINRLNYTRKYMMKALENHKVETNVHVFYSVDGICMALQKWSTDNCLGITAAQNVYAEICKSAGVEPAPIYLEGKEFAGVKNTVVYHKVDDFSFIQNQMEKYGNKMDSNKKILGIMAGVLLAAGIIILIVVAITGADKEGKGEKKDPVKVEQPKEEPKQEEPVVDEPQDEESEDDTPDNQANANDYIFPDSNTRELTRAEVEALSTEQLRIAKNEIFARYGMIFGAQDMKAYFESKSWYEPTIPYDDFQSRVEMNLTEEANVALILEVEGTR